MVPTLLATAVLLAVAITAAGSSQLDQTYHKVIEAGDMLAGKKFGLSTTYDGQPIYATNWASLSSVTVDTTKEEISNAQDFTALIKLNAAVYMTVQTEFYPPSHLFVVKMRQDPKTGALKAVDFKRADFSEWGGLWLACSGHVTEVNGKSLIMGAEEYEPNARHWATAANLTDMMHLYEGDFNYQFGYVDIANFMRYFGIYPVANDKGLPVVTFEDIKSKFNPYLYGYITTAQVQVGGEAVVSKLLTSGRISHELGYVMPDKKTIYMTDDHGSGGGLFMFKADKKGVFTQGTLYAAKVTQLTPNGGAPEASEFDVTWVELGKGSQDVLLEKAQHTTFLDIFEIDFSGEATFSCAPGFTSINTATGFECLKLKAGKEMEAAFFETRRYAAMLGATVEFSKGEGLAHSKATGELYLAVSVVRRGMENNGNRGSPSTRYDIGGPNDIRVAFNPCGCIFALTLDDAYKATKMAGRLCGLRNGASTSQCLNEGIAGPDNIEVVGDKLIIAEDSEGAHAKNFIWAMDIPTGQLTRIYSMDVAGGAEFTSPYKYDINGRSYMVTNINNYDFDKGVKGAVGYFGPWPKTADGTPVSFNAV